MRKKRGLMPDMPRLFVQRRSSPPRASMSLFALACLFCAANADAWEKRAPLTVKVHQHHFHEVRVSAQECTLSVLVRFEAPENKYAAGNPVADYYRFRPRLEMSDNMRVDGPIFFNRKPGRRMFRFEHDTSNAGCWAKKRRSLRRVEIDACRGQRCTPKSS